MTVRRKKELVEESKKRLDAREAEKKLVGESIKRFDTS
jgi:hypothetical protein